MTDERAARISRVECLESRQLLFGIGELPQIPGPGDFPEIGIDPDILLFADAAVDFNDVQIADGDNTPSATDGTSFGTILQGFSGPTRTFTITNEGNKTLTLGDVNVTGAFQVVDQPPNSLFPGLSGTFSIKMLTSSAGTKNGTVSFATNSPGENPFNFSIRGTVLNFDIGIDIDPVLKPEVTVLDGSDNISDGTGNINFGAVVKDSASPTKVFTVRNDGTANLTLGAVSVPAGYSLTEPLVASLAPGATDTFSVALNTNALGDKSGQISFATNDSNENPFNFNIEGEVTPAPAPEIEIALGATVLTDGAANVDFGDVFVGDLNPVKTFTVRNLGTATLTLGGVSLPAGFGITEALDASLAPGASDTFTVAMTTAVTGTPTGALSITNNDSNENPFNFNLEGTISPAPEADAPVATLLVGPAPVPDGQATPIDFGAGVLGQAGPVVTFTMRNDGGTPLTLGTPTLPIGFSLVEGLNTELAPGASDTFQVQLNTGALGTFSGSISIPTSDPLRNPYDFAISGVVEAQVAGESASNAAITGPLSTLLDAGTVPNSVIGGDKKAKGKVFLLVTNTTGAKVKGLLTGSILASQDQAVSLDDLSIGSFAKNVTVKAGQTKIVKVKVNFGVPTTPGNHNLLASLTFNGEGPATAIGNRLINII